MFDVLEAQKRRPAMKKISTLQAFSNEILKEQKLTISLDLGDRNVCFIASGVVATSCSRMIFRSLIALGKPAVNRTGTRSDRGSRTKIGIDHREQSKAGQHAQTWQSSEILAIRSNDRRSSRSDLCKSPHPQVRGLFLFRVRSVKRLFTSAMSAGGETLL
jgi:hypothetical protein